MVSGKIIFPSMNLAQARRLRIMFAGDTISSHTKYRWKLGTSVVGILWKTIVDQASDTPRKMRYSHKATYCDCFIVLNLILYYRQIRGCFRHIKVFSPGQHRMPEISNEIRERYGHPGDIANNHYFNLGMNGIFTTPSSSGGRWIVNVIAHILSLTPISVLRDSIRHELDTLYRTGSKYM